MHRVVKKENRKIVYSILICELVGMTSLVTALRWSRLLQIIVIPHFYNYPDYVFVAVWVILYFLMGISFGYIWKIDKRMIWRNYNKLLFVFQLGLSIYWSWLFFRFQSYDMAFFIILLFTATLIATSIYQYKLSRMSMWFFIIYSIWACFATVLNFMYIH